MPTTGHVRLNGRDLFAMGEKMRCLARNRHLGFIYQFHHLLPEFTAIENVAMPQLIAGSDKALARSRAESLGIDPRRIGIARHFLPRSRAVPVPLYDRE